MVPEHISHGVWHGYQPMLAEITTSVQYRLSSYVLKMLLPDKTSQKYEIQVHIGITENLLCEATMPDSVSLRQASWGGDI